MRHDAPCPRLALVLFLILASMPITAAAQSAPASAPQLLDVPYLAQPPELCGGAALAMVLRYWGARDIFPEDFQGFVDAKARGIPTSSLVTFVRKRGWVALELDAQDDGLATFDGIGRALGLGRPVVALIEVRPQTYHYVVITGLTADRVVFHDPAVGPHRVLARDEFRRAWDPTKRWMIVVLPSPSLGLDAPPRADSRAAATQPTRCDALVSESIAAARSDQAAAERGLRDATIACPESAAPWRELAGLRFLQSRWTEAAADAEAATIRDPDDEDAWRLLASSRFMTDDRIGALAAWNRVGELHADLTSVEGLELTRAPVVVRRVGLEPRSLLTPDAFLRASRRLSDLPSAAFTRLRFDPIGDGRARLNAVVAERERFPHDWRALTQMAVWLAVSHDLRYVASSLLGAGELWRLDWRWAARRPALSVTMAVPDVQPLRGITTIHFLTESQTYRLRPDGAVSPEVSEARRRVMFGLTDWATSRLHWQIAGGLDRIAERDRLALSSALDWRLAGDHIALGAAGGWWSPGTGATRAFTTGSASAAWRSTTRAAQRVLQISASLSTASPTAPLAVWSGAGTGLGRDALLRAHPLLVDDIIAGPAFGRTLAQTTSEYSHPLVTRPFGSLALAGFVDAANAWQGLAASASGWLVDVGGGLRVRAPGLAGALRLDIAHSVSSGGFVLSAGWSKDWPARRLGTF